MKPLIGINIDIEEGPKPRGWIFSEYYESLQKAGAAVVLLPPMPEQDLDILIRRLDGLCLIGGPDYSPSLYGEETHPSVKLMDSRREEFDRILVRKVLNETDLPLLGICAGCQLLNISLGGTLVQDIHESHPDSAVIHTRPKGWNLGVPRHSVRVEPDSQLFRIYGKESFSVPTSHHQSVKKPGRGLKVTAWADDGVIEAVEMPERGFTVGVQWHPERDFEGNRSLFAEFVRNCTNGKQSK